MIKARISHENMGWNTPKDLFEELDREFHFVLDVASNDLNHKCVYYYTAEDDGLSQPWDVLRGAVFCNPPYGRILKRWVQKAYEESTKGTTVVMLIPARTDTSWFHDIVLPHAEVRFLRGRVRYTDVYGIPAGDSAPFPSMIVIFKGVKT
jgi:phage N-6-adenine-methyltransferase